MVCVLLRSDFSHLLKKHSFGDSNPGQKRPDIASAFLVMQNVTGKNIRQRGASRWPPPNLPQAKI